MSHLRSKEKATYMSEQNDSICTLDKDYRYHVGYSQFSNIGWLNVESRVAQIKASHIHKIVNKSAPMYLQEQFDCMLMLHQYRTSHSQLAIRVPNVGSEGYGSFLYTGIKIWNSLPFEIQSIRCNSVFKKVVKQHLFNNMENVESSNFLFY